MDAGHDAVICSSRGPYFIAGDAIDARIVFYVSSRKGKTCPVKRAANRRLVHDSCPTSGVTISPITQITRTFAQRETIVRTFPSDRKHTTIVSNNQYFLTLNSHFFRSVVYVILARELMCDSDSRIFG